MHLLPFLDPLVGKVVSHVWFGDHGALFIELGELSPIEKRKDGSPRNPKGQITVDAEFGWRIERKRSILAGSGSSQRLLKAAAKTLVNQQVEAVSAFGVLPELAIEFSNGLRVTTFSRYEGQPRWVVLFGSPKRPTVFVKGGRICAEKRDA